MTVIPHREWIAREAAKYWPRFSTSEIAEALRIPEHAVWNAIDRVKEIRAAVRGSVRHPSSR